jgi:hypothetical protein
MESFRPPFPELAPGHWALLTWWMAASATACVVIMASARILLPRLIPSLWQSMAKARLYQVPVLSKNFAEFVPALTVPWLVFGDTRRLTAQGLAAPSASMGLAAAEGTWAACGAIFG